MFEKFKNKGLTGLANLGNTCFMNSAIQCLSHTYEFNLFLDSEKYKNELNNIPDSVILVEWDKLRKLMWKENCIISPGGFLGAIQKVALIKKKLLFTGFAQNDLTEFLNFIIDCFHMSIQRKVVMNIQGNILNENDKLAEKCYKMVKQIYENEYSEILNIFYGIHISNIKTLEGKVLSNCPEPFSMLHLSIPNKKDSITIMDCLDLYTENELLDGENMYEKNGEKYKVYKKIFFWKLPEILVILLKRFICDGRNNTKKNKIKVDFPLTNLDLSKYVKGYNNHCYVYNLYGICNHSGNVNGGHYTAIIKNANDKWYHFNDTSCTEIANLEQMKTNKAYCLFYRKKKMNE